MDKQLEIFDHLKRPTGRFCSPESPQLDWNEFVPLFSCMVFDSIGHLLIVRRKETSHSELLWDVLSDYLYEGEEALTACKSLISSFFNPVPSLENLSFLRSLKRRYTLIDLYELHIDQDITALLLPEDICEARFVSEVEFDELCANGLVRESARAAFHYREMRAMHYKNIYRTGWPRVTSCEYEWEYVRDGLLNGVLSLLHINTVLQPCVKYMEGRDFVITDDGYYWFQYAPKEENFWLTVMFDREMNLVQYYFDISYRNEVFWDGNAYFFDLYLDIVLLPNGHQIILDEDELIDAYQSGQITKSMLDLAYREQHRLSELIDGHEPQLRELCLRHVKRLKRRMEQRQPNQVLPLP